MLLDVTDTAEGLRCRYVTLLDHIADSLSSQVGPDQRSVLCLGPNLSKQVLDVTPHDCDCDGAAVHPRLFARGLHVELITVGLFAFVDGFMMSVGMSQSPFHDPASTEVWRIL